MAGGFAPEKHTVLVVDDEESSRFILKAIISRMGFNVVLAEHGQDALDAMKKSKPSAVLSDLKMPYLDGFQLIEAMVNDNLEVPFIMLTGFYSTDVQEKAVELGVITILPKPPDEFLIKGFLKEAITLNQTPQNMRQKRQADKDAS